MSLTLARVRPDEDAALLHGWVSAERARFWGMADKPLEEVRDIYAYIDDQPHLTASLILADDVPIGLFQTYDPFVDEIGEHYERQPGDLGVHLLLADTAARQGRTAEVLRFLLGQVFADPEVRRMVLEPDHENTKSLALLERLGATLGPRRELPGKIAQFGFVERPR